MAGDSGRDEGHVTIDVGVIGGNRVQRGQHHRDQDVSSGRHASHNPRQKQPCAPGARRRVCRGWCRRSGDRLVRMRHLLCRRGGRTHRGLTRPRCSRHRLGKGRPAPLLSFQNVRSFVVPILFLPVSRSTTIGVTGLPDAAQEDCPAGLGGGQATGVLKYDIRKEIECGPSNSHKLD